jgi:hypothetical protein
MGATATGAPHVWIKPSRVSSPNLNGTLVGLSRPTTDSLSHDVSMHDWRMSTTHSSDLPRNPASKNET